MQVLSIGNSFSQDAQRYLSAMARSAGQNLTSVNLYIGGCSLEQHFRNMHSGERLYSLECNGTATGFSVSLKEALLTRAWDVVTLQQASHFSFRYETYQPYACELADYVRRLSPKAKIFVHQTWAYEQGSKLLNGVGFNNQKDMFDRLRDAYGQMARDVQADGILSSGALMQELLANGVTDLHRDGFHLSLGTGRAAAALLWLHTLTGADVSNLDFHGFDAPVPEEIWHTVRRCVQAL